MLNDPFEDIEVPEDTSKPNTGPSKSVFPDTEGNFVSGINAIISMYEKYGDIPEVAGIVERIKQHYGLTGDDVRRAKDVALKQIAKDKDLEEDKIRNAELKAIEKLIDVGLIDEAQSRLETLWNTERSNGLAYLTADVYTKYSGMIRAERDRMSRINQIVDSIDPNDLDAAEKIIRAAESKLSKKDRDKLRERLEETQKQAAIDANKKAREQDKIASEKAKINKDYADDIEQNIQAGKLNEALYLIKDPKSPLSPDQAALYSGQVAEAQRVIQQTQEVKAADKAAAEQRKMQFEAGKIAAKTLRPGEPPTAGELRELQFRESADPNFTPKDRQRLMELQEAQRQLFGIEGMQQAPEIRAALLSYAQQMGKYGALPSTTGRLGELTQAAATSYGVPSGTIPLAGLAQEIGVTPVTVLGSPRSAESLALMSAQQRGLVPIPRADEGAPSKGFYKTTPLIVGTKQALRPRPILAGGGRAQRVDQSGGRSIRTTAPNLPDWEGRAPRFDPDLSVPRVPSLTGPVSVPDIPHIGIPQIGYILGSFNQGKVPQPY